MWVGEGGVKGVDGTYQIGSPVGSESFGSSIRGVSLSSVANESWSLCTVPSLLMPVSMRTSPPCSLEYLVM